MHDAIDLRDLVAGELVAAREAGGDTGDLAREVAALGPDASDERLAELLDRLAAVPRRADWPYTEPSDLPGILATLPAPGPEHPAPAGADLRDRILGAWLGRCAGCNLGKPIEQGEVWTPERIRSYLERADAWPLDDYLPVLDPMPDGLALRDNWPETTRGRVTASARDDDVDYTILGLLLLETHGPGFRTEHVAALWLDRLPFTQVYTAERVAYRNLIRGLAPPATATWRNPYREWIGAQIRADIFGDVHPGRPRAAAVLAHRDARLSHVANGIYGEMWAAALVAAAFTAPTARDALIEAQRHIPPGSRLAEALTGVLDLHNAGCTWEEALERIRGRHGHYSWVHTINNAALVAAGLLWGEDDFTRTIGLTVAGGWDTDSNGATAGSVAGILTGAARLPHHWVEPLNDQVRSAIRGFDRARISELAERTAALAEQPTT